MNKSLIKKSEIIEGLDVDKYLEAIIEKYEGFYISERRKFNKFEEKANETLYRDLLSITLRQRDNKKRKDSELLEIFKRYEKKITKKDIEIDKAVEEKRKLLILAIKKIRR